VAWHEHESLSWTLLALSLIAAVLVHAGANVLNDYFDFRSGADNLNPHPLTPFAGGSRMIQRGLLTARETLCYGALLLTSGVVLGLLLVAMTGPMLLAIGLIGVCSAVSYSCPPLALNYRGFGELLIGLNFGVLPVLGSYYVQTQSLSSGAVVASLPLAFLVAAILYINQFPDYEFDLEAGKKTAVVLLGPQRAASAYVVLPLTAFVTIILGVVASWMPATSLMTLLVLPLALFAAQKPRVVYEDADAMRVPIKSTIALHTLTSALLVLAYL